MPDLRSTVYPTVLVRALQDHLLPASLGYELGRHGVPSDEHSLPLQGKRHHHHRDHRPPSHARRRCRSLGTCRLPSKLLGEFAIDDNEGLADPAPPLFLLEVRDVSIPPIEHRYLPNKGWKQVTTSECLTLLESSGVIDRP